MRHSFQLRLTLALFLLAVSALIVGRDWQSIRSAPNDFIPLYVAAGHAFSPDLYAEEPYRAFLTERYGQDVPALRYSRPPFYAVLLAPFAPLPFEDARLVFSILKLAAIALVGLLWAVPSRREAAWAVVASIPLWMSFVAGQDVPFVLLALVGACALLERRPQAAGAVLALCAIKFHLFLTLPIWLLQKDRRPVAKGFALGALGLILASFLQQGIDWPARYAATLLNPAINPSEGAMPNLHGLLGALPGSNVIEACLTLAILWLCWRAVRGADSLGGLAICLLGGLLISRHAYLSDLAVLVPTVLILRQQQRPLRLSLPIALVLIPIPLLLPQPWPLLVQAGLVALFAGAVGKHFVRPTAAEA